MGCSVIPKKIVSIAHGAAGLANPLGGSIDENVDFAEVRAGVQKAATLYLRGYGCRATARFGTFATPIARGTKADLVFTLQQVGESANTTVTLKNSRAGSTKMDFDGDPVYSQSQEFVHDTADSDDTAPITVA